MGEKGIFQTLKPTKFISTFATLFTISADFFFSSLFVDETLAQLHQLGYFMDMLNLSSTFKNKILLTLAVILAISAAGLFYVNKVLLPVQIKGMAVQAAENALGRKVTLGTLQWTPVKGFTITELTIFNKQDPTEVFLYIKNASAQVLLVPFFQKKIIIPSVSIDELSARLIRLTPNTWNFSDLMSPAGTSSAPMPNVIVSGLTITNARVKLTDLSLSEPFTEMIGPINIKGSLALPAHASLSGDIELPFTQGTLHFETRTGLRDKTFTGEFKVSNVIPNRYLRFAPTSLPVTITEGTLRNASFTVTAQEPRLTISGNFDIPGLKVQLPQNISYAGDLRLNTITWDQKPDLSTLSGNISSQNTQAILPENKTISGEITTSIKSLTIDKTSTTFNGEISTKNLSVLLDQTKTVTGDIQTKDTSLTFKNGTVNGTTALTATGLTIIPALGQKITGNIQIPLVTIGQTSTELLAAGDLTGQGLLIQIAPDQTIATDLSLNKSSLRIDAAETRLQGDILLKNLQASLESISAKGELSAPGTSLAIAKDRLDLRGQIKLTNTTLKLPQGISFNGSPQITLHLSQLSDVLKYSGSLNLSEGALQGVPTVGTIDDIRGQVTFETNALTIKELNLKTFNTPISLSGNITNFADIQLALKATAQNVDLSLIEKAAPQFMQEQGLTAAGLADVSLSITGAAAAINPSMIDANITLKNATLNSSKIKQKATDINGTLKLSGSILSWDQLTFSTQEKTFLLNGHLQDFTSPIITSSIKTEELNAEFEIKKINDLIRIASANAQWFDSTVKLSGQVDLPPGKTPLIDITASGKIVLNDLKKLSAQLAQQIETLKLAGIIKFKTSIQGEAAAWMNWTSTLEASSLAVSVMGYQFDNVELTAKQKDGRIDPVEINGNFYAGDFSVISALTLSDKTLPFESTFKLTRTNLEMLKRDIPALKTRQIAGFLTIAGSLAGNVADWKMVKGKSTVQITEGYLWETAVLSKLLNILSTSIQGGDMIITDAGATFLIADGKIDTNNLTLKSAAVTLLGEGWLDFDQNLDLNITPRLEPLANGTGLEAFNPSAGLLNIHITGTLQKPVFEHNLSTPTMIRKTLQNTVGNILKIFE